MIVSKDGEVMSVSNLASRIITGHVTEDSGIAILPSYPCVGVWIYNPMNVSVRILSTNENYSTGFPLKPEEKIFLQVKDSGIIKVISEDTGLGTTINYLILAL